VNDADGRRWTTSRNLIEGSPARAAAAALAGCCASHVLARVHSSTLSPATFEFLPSVRPPAAPGSVPSFPRHRARCASRETVSLSSPRPATRDRWASRRPYLRSSSKLVHPPPLPPYTPVHASASFVRSTRTRLKKHRCSNTAASDNDPRERGIATPREAGVLS